MTCTSANESPAGDQSREAARSLCDAGVYDGGGAEVVRAAGVYDGGEADEGGRKMRTRPQVRRHHQ